MSELAALRELLADALARVEALEAAERAQDTRQQQVDLLCAALAALDPHARLSRWAAAQRLAALVQTRAIAYAVGRRPARDSERLVDEAGRVFAAGLREGTQRCLGGLRSRRFLTVYPDLVVKTADGPTKTSSSSVTPV